MQIYIIILNALVVFLLLIAGIFPALLFEKGLAAEFLRMVWPLGLILLLAIGTVNIMYLRNRKLLSLLDKGDWPALADYLEKKIYQDGKYSSRHVRLLAQSFLIQGNFDAAMGLKDKVAAVKPALLEANALFFGVAYLLGGKADIAVEFFKERLDKGQSADNEWIRWYYGFSLMIGGYLELAEGVFEKLASDSRDVFITGLSAYFLADKLGKNSLAQAEWRVHADAGKSRVRKIVKTAGKWEKKAQKMKAEVCGAIIRKYIDEAGIWIFGET